MDNHRCQLDVRCRVCGRKRDKGRSHKAAAGLEFEILSVFGVDVRQDDASRHPTKLCTTCSTFIKRATSAGPSCRLPQTSIVPVLDWPDCPGEGCSLCREWEEEKKGGRPSKAKKAGRKGRPPGGGKNQGKGKENEQPVEESDRTALLVLPTPTDPALAGRLQPFAHQQELLPERFPDVSSESVICPVCKNVLDKPVAVPVPGCEHACCMDCWQEWLKVSPTCPVCRNDVASGHLQPVSRFLWSHLCSLRVHCDFWQHGCDTVVQLVELRQHASSCPFTHHQEVRPPPATTTVAAPGPAEDQAQQPAVATAQPAAVYEQALTQLGSAPDDQPVSKSEHRYLAGLLRRLTHEHQRRIGLPIFTGGRPTHISFTPAPSGNGNAPASDRSRQRRRTTLHEIEKLVCGTEQEVRAQRAFDLARSSQEEREELLIMAKVHHSVSPAESLAMAVHLRLSYEQLRKLRLWTKKWRVSLAAERQARSFAKDQMGDVEVGSEMVQVVGSDDHQVRCFKPAALAWVKNPIALIVQHLSSLQKRNLLTWHPTESGSSLPPGEVWLKIGGDKGGGSFKMAFQIANQPHPNSADHTVVFACLEADDNLPNMHIALDTYRQVVSELHGMKWR